MGPPQSRNDRRTGRSCEVKLASNWPSQGLGGTRKRPATVGSELPALVMGQHVNVLKFNQRAV